MGCQDGTPLRCSHGCLALFLEYVVRKSKYCFTGAVSEITGSPPNCPGVGLEQETLMQAFPCYCTYMSFTQSRRPCCDLGSDSWKSLGWLKSLLHPHLQTQGPQTMVSVSLVSHLLSPLHQVLQVLGRQGLQYLLPGIKNNISAKPPEQLGFLLLVPLPLSNAFSRSFNHGFLAAESRPVFQLWMFSVPCNVSGLYPLYLFYSRPSIQVCWCLP